MLERHICGQVAGDLVDRRQLASLGVRPLGRPALDLTFDVALSPSEVAETDRIDVGIVQVGQYVDQVLARLAAQFRWQLVGPLGAVEHDSRHVLHHVERRLVDRFIGAQTECSRHRNVGPTDGSDDSMLALHVVGGRQHMPGRRAPQHVALVVGIADEEREVGTAADDQVEPEGRDRPVDVGGEPSADSVVVDALHDRRP